MLAHQPLCRWRITCDSCLRGPCSWNQSVSWMALPPALGDRHQSSVPVDSVFPFVSLQDMIQPAEAAKPGVRLRLWHLHSGRQTHTGCGAASKKALWLNRLRTARCHTKPVIYLFFFFFYPSAVWLPLPYFTAARLQPWRWSGNRRLWRKARGRWLWCTCVSSWQRLKASADFDCNFRF